MLDRKRSRDKATWRRPVAVADRADVNSEPGTAAILAVIWLTSTNLTATMRLGLSSSKIACRNPTDSSGAEPVWPLIRASRPSAVSSHHPRIHRPSAWSWARNTPTGVVGSCIQHSAYASPSRPPADQLPGANSVPYASTVSCRHAQPSKWGASPSRSERTARFWNATYR